MAYVLIDVVKNLL